VVTISNYSGKIFLLKGLVSSLLIIAMIAQVKMNNEKWQPMINNNGFKKLFSILFLFICYLSLTLTYSSNPAYGFQKILNFIISIVPSVIVFYYLISTLNELRLKLFLYSISAITIVSVIFIIINYPFDQSTIYHYKPGRWSHVIYGRMISSIAVVLLSYLMWVIKKGKASLLPKKLTTLEQVRDTPWQEKRWEIIFLIFVTSMAIYGTYLSALRAAFVGLMLVGVGLLVISAWFVVRSSRFKNSFTGKRVHSELTKNEEPAYRSGRLRTQNVNMVYSLLIITILSALLIFLIPKPDIINYRFDNMIAIDDLQFKDDPAIHSRLDSWELSWEMIKEHPLIGTGLGGFNGYNNIEWTKAIKYPHNIILEMTAEGGVVGLLVLCSLFVVIFKSSYRFSKFTFYFLLFTLFLSMFSKEFSNQSLLWVGLAFVGMGRERFRTEDIE